MEKRTKRFVVFVGAILLASVLVLTNIHIIPTGYTGVRYKFGLVSEQPVPSGKIVFSIPVVESIKKICNKLQDYRCESQIWGETKDKTPVYAQDITVSYQVSPERSVWICANVSSLNLLTENLVASAMKTAMVELGPDDVTARSKIEPLAAEKLQAALDEKYGENTVYVAKLTIGNMDFDDDYNEAIKARSQASKKQETARIENETAIANAEAAKKVAVLEAEAAAERVRIAAKAEAEANEMVNASLSGNLLALKRVQAWDGKMPMVVGGSSNLMLGLGELAEAVE